MKLKEDFITQDIDGTQFLVPVGAEAFQGIVRSNKTAAMIVDMLKTETTLSRIVDAICARYDVPRETAAADAAGIIALLKNIGALEE